MPLAPPGQLRIGDALIAARARAGLDLKQVEERTKIRAKYLRALEEEDWDELPSASHAKGFLRTYAQLLGLDAELLVDEYRRQVETGAEGIAGPLSDRLLERRRSAGVRQGPRPLWILAGIVTILVAALVVIGLATDDEVPQPSNPRPKQGAAGGDREPRRGNDKGTVRMRISVVSPVEVCLVGGEGNALIDGQVLAAGTRDEYRGKRLDLRFPVGFESSQVRIHLGSKRVELPAVEGPAAFRIAPPARVREASPPGRRCP